MYRPLDIVVKCPIPPTDMDALVRVGSLTVTLTRTIAHAANGRDKDELIDTKAYPPVLMKAAAPARPKQNLVACSFVNLASDLYRPTNAALRGRVLTVEMGLKLVSNWLAYHRYSYNMHNALYKKFPPSSPSPSSRPAKVTRFY